MSLKHDIILVFGLDPRLRRLVRRRFAHYCKRYLQEQELFLEYFKRNCRKCPEGVCCGNGQNVSFQISEDAVQRRKPCCIVKHGRLNVYDLNSFYLIQTSGETYRMFAN